MTEIPDTPDDFDSDEELQQYIKELEDHIEFLEDELEESEKDKLELREELNQIQNSSLGGNEKLLEEVADLLHRLNKSTTDLENKEPPSEDSANLLDDATGYDGR